jgi:hypothetical protein
MGFDRSGPQDSSEHPRALARNLRTTGKALDPEGLFSCHELSCHELLIRRRIKYLPVIYLTAGTLAIA